MITGASRGLGAALALHLAGPGTALRLVGRDAAALAEVAGACAAAGAEVAHAPCDVTDAPALARLLRGWDAARPVTHVVANAGVTSGTPEDGGLEDPAAARRTLEVNLQGAINAVEPLLPAFRARRAGQVALVCSVAAFRGLPDSPAYCAAKAGLWAWGEGLRARLAPEGVRVSVLAPGFFRSAMSARFTGAHPGERDAAAMAAALWRGVERGRGRVVVPGWLGAGLRLLALLPSPLSDRLVRLHRFRITAAR
ncbi:SDR family NAD(P)-dependent oxidoreductase [Roseococcus sp. DSY-14]|uniref:SDR family NAD(P)-dependent oxidoreductase n=1 Tax=Roseococcus sp. DSY-14 TaxID=3369650 RepID=UPI00387AEA5D